MSSSRQHGSSAGPVGPDSADRPPLQGPKKRLQLHPVEQVDEKLGGVRRHAR